MLSFFLNNVNLVIYSIIRNSKKSNYIGMINLTYDTNFIEDIRYLFVI